MDFYVIALLQVLVAFANLALISAGLAIIFGMMRIINFAHGEFLMLGGYAAIVSNQAGLNLWIAIFILSPVVVGAIGAILEALIIRRLYGRMIDTMLATWGISLSLIGIVTVIFGNSVSGISPPLGSISVGQYAIGTYEILLLVVVVAIFGCGWLFLQKTSMGLIARATMQNRHRAASLGVDQKKVYAVTFIVGAALTGLAGGLIAPIAGIVPSIGSLYIAKAFITVILGGPAMLVGTLCAAATLAAVNTFTAFVMNSVVSEVAVLAAAIILLRMLPNGITGKFFRRSL